MSFHSESRARSEFHSHSLKSNVRIWANMSQTSLKVHLLKLNYNSIVASTESVVRYSAVEIRGIKCNYTACNETNNFDILTDTKDHISATHLGITIKERFSYRHIYSLTETPKLPYK